MTSPNTTCLSSSHDVTTVVMKNYPSFSVSYTIPKPKSYLRTIRVGAAIGHREQSRLVMLQLEVLIYKTNG